MGPTQALSVDSAGHSFPCICLGGDPEATGSRDIRPTLSTMRRVVASCTLVGFPTTILVATLEITLVGKEANQKMRLWATGCFF